MTVWTWSLAGIASLFLVYAALVVALVVAGQRTTARALAGFIPDCIVLFTRLLRDPRAPRRKKLLLVALIGYLALPFDLVPDFIRSRDNSTTSSSLRSFSAASSAAAESR
jgi:hypothetical protein